ncbi:MAG: spore coat associated protein CotJA [Clostridiales bacterium]|nr:spore coat associated protein CotJA [Clostridiales bacterium]
MPVAMAYVPWQTFHDKFELCKALEVGTIFPELCKPFCGKRGCR